MTARSIANEGGASGLLRDRRFRAVLVVLVLACAVAAVLALRSPDSRRVVLSVDGRETRMDYFVRRVAMSGLEPLLVLRNLAFEEIMLAEAPNPPFNIALSEAEVDAFIRAAAAGGTGSIGDAEFDLWLRQQANETGLSRDQHRDYMKRQLLYERMTDVLAARQPRVTPQVRLSTITGLTAQAADGVMQRLAGGVGFAELAAEMNTMPRLKASSGDIGWYTRDELDADFATTVFDAQQVGEAGRPFQGPDGTYQVVMVTDRDESRAIGQVAFQTIRAGLLARWLEAQFPLHEVRYRGLTGGYDSETDAWVRARVGEISQNAADPS